MYTQAGMAGISLDRHGWMDNIQWSAFHEESHFGYLRISIASKQAIIEFVSSSPDSQGKVIDSVTILHAWADYVTK